MYINTFLCMYPIISICLYMYKHMCMYNYINKMWFSCCGRARLRRAQCARIRAMLAHWRECQTKHVASCLPGTGAGSS